MTTRNDIVQAARSYIGVRWRHLGRSRAGLDCIGLLVVVAQDCGIDIQDDTEYGRVPDSRKFMDLIYSQSTTGAMTAIKSGSVLLFQQAGRPCHTGIVCMDVAPATVIHASLITRQVSEQPLSTMYRDIIGVREFKGVTD